MLKSNSLAPSLCRAAMVRSMINLPGEQFDHFSPALLMRTIR